jgi:tetratricopeptide (TPR) repeat protein
VPVLDYYQALQVTPGAEPEVIEAAYKRLAFKYHADRNPAPDAHSRMVLLNEAYETLSDPARRAAYDRDRATREPTAGPPSAAPPLSPPSALPFPWATFWRPPYSSHPLALPATVAVFCLAVPVALQWVLASAGAWGLISLAGTLTGYGFLILTKQSWLPLAPPPAPGGVLTAGPELKRRARRRVAAWLTAEFAVGVLVGAGGPWVLGHMLEVDTLAFAVFIWAMLNWGVWLGVLSIAGGARELVRHARAVGEPVHRTAWVVWGVALLAAAAGGLVGPSHPTWLLLQGGKAFKMGDKDQAIRLLDRAIARDHDLSAAYRIRWALRRNRGDNAGAIEDLSQVIRLEPDDGEAWLRRGVLRSVTNDWAGAADDLAAGLAGVPDAAHLTPDRRAEILHYRDVLGTAWYRLGRLDLAGLEFDRALALDPGAVEVHLWRGIVHLDRGESGPAIPHFTRAIDLAPGDTAGSKLKASAYRNRARARAVIGETGEAAADRAQADRLDGGQGAGNSIQRPTPSGSPGVARVRDRVTREVTAIGRLLVSGTHPTGTFDSAQMVLCEDFQHAQASRVTVRCCWRGISGSAYQTDYVFDVDTLLGAKNLRIAADSSLFTPDEPHRRDTQELLHDYWKSAR